MGKRTEKVSENPVKDKIGWRVKYYILKKICRKIIVNTNNSVNSNSVNNNSVNNRLTVICYRDL